MYIYYKKEQLSNRLETHCDKWNTCNTATECKKKCRIQINRTLLHRYQLATVINTAGNNPASRLQKYWHMNQTRKLNRTLTLNTKWND